jgi:Ca2+-binding RTX toxin-like protein
VVVGGPGSDMMGFSAGPAVASLVTGIATGEGTDTMFGIENLKGSPQDDVLTGDDGPNRIGGGGGLGLGRDRLYGLGGDDVIAGGDDNDFLDGGPGTDSLDGGNHDDTCVNGEAYANC